VWISLALLCALLTGSGDAISKKLLDRSGERVVGWAKLLFTLPWLGLGWICVQPPLPGGEFWLLAAAAIPVEVAAYLCYLRAIRVAPLSLAVPFLALTPMLTVLTSRLFLGEGVAPAGFFGVCSVAGGAYVLQVDRAARGILEPLRAMLRNPGIRLMLLTAALFSITATLGKRMIALSSPAAFLFYYFGVEALVLSEWIRRGPGGFRAVWPEVRGQAGLYALSGVVLAGALFAHASGIVRAPVPYFLSIKRLSLLVSVLYGGLLFREQAMRQRVVGAALMLAGAVVITCAGAR